MKKALLIVFVVTGVAFAQAGFKAPKINAGNELRKNLQEFQDAKSKVQVSLKVGRVIVGRVTDVGREFFLMDDLDESAERAALVRMDDVAAITYQARPSKQ